MTDERGTFEHAHLTEPRPEHGYCTDDMARVLVVASREPDPTPAVCRLVEVSLRFLSNAQGLNGDYRNRMNVRGKWIDRRSVGDWWGRSIWGLGTAASKSDVDWVRQSALVQFERAALQRSTWPRAMAFAALGAAEVATVTPGHRLARDLLADAADQMTTGSGRGTWPWPEPRLTYANAALPEAMIAAGTALPRPALLERGLELLAWLVDYQTVDGHLSVVPAGGVGADDPRPWFDQQPIEVAALADACARAAVVDGNPRWAAGVGAAVAWFLGDNDRQVPMWCPASGGGYDGLEADGVNMNQGTESTLALLSTFQHARHLVPASL